MTGNGLRAARTARGWSQSRAAREIAALGRNRGTPVAAEGSLKTLLSRWENGHALPDPPYRQLLGALFERTPEELGIAGSQEPGGHAGEAAGRLLASVAAAAAVGPEALRLWSGQLDLARRLDDELGAAGAAGLVRAQAEQLDRTLAHTIGPAPRSAVASLLADAAALAGDQALDGAEPDTAWMFFGRAHTAAREADRPVAAAAALAGQAAALIDAGDPAAAIALIGDECPPGPAQVRVRWEAARGLAHAAAGHADAVHTAFAAAGRASERAGGAPPDVGPTDRDRPDGVRFAVDRPDVVHARAGVEVELAAPADLHRWHGHALVTLGDPSAVAPLECALAAGPRSARHRAALHADLAVALRARRPDTAAEHARTARELAVRIGSARIAAQLAAPAGAP